VYHFRICFTPGQIGCQLKNGTPKVVENGFAIFLQQVIEMLKKATQNISVLKSFTTSKIFESTDTIISETIF